MIKDCKKKFRLYKHDIDFNRIDYNRLKDIVISGRDILSTLISNENISEHEMFSDLLMTLMHLRDEITFMGDRELTDEDKRHLETDISRVYKVLSLQWTSYLKHLKQFYPYQYNSAIAVNPFINHSINTEYAEE